MARQKSPSPSQLSRDAVIAEALTWEKTPYHEHASVKGVGADCAQFPAAVYHACGLIPKQNPIYDDQWHLHRDEELYLKWVQPLAREIPLDRTKGGDFIIWKWGRTYSHGGILLTPEIVIHAQKPVGITKAKWREDSYLGDPIWHPAKAFTLWSD